MWSLRRAAFTLKKQGHFLKVSSLFGVQCDTLSNFSEDKASGCYPAQFFPKGDNYHTLIFGKFLLGNRRFSSQVSEEGHDENDKKDAILELRESHPAPVIEDNDVEEEVWEEWVLEPRFLDDSSDSEEGQSIREPLKKKDSLELFRSILDSSSHSISSIINNFIRDGKDLSHGDVSRIIYNLLNRRMYGKALKLSDWMETTKHFELNDHDYAFRLDLIAKVRQVDEAEKYMEKIPDSSRGELLYRTLLTNYVYIVNRKKAEGVFNKMRDLGLPITIHACNQMIILYRRFDRKKIADILLLMEENNLKPSRLTYRILIATKGELNDTMGMEHLVEDMKSGGLHPDIYVLKSLASHYISRGMKDKAIAILKEIEGGNLRESIVARCALLSLYASLDMVDEVSRIWNCYKLDPTKKLCLEAIAAWGKLGRVEEAEEVFETITQKWTKLTSRYYSELLSVYVQNNQMSKGKELIKRLKNSGFWTGPLLWDGLVRLYVQAGDMEKADSILSRASQNQKVRPLFSTYLFVMEQYAERGDIYNTEKWFLRMRWCGYSGRLRPFEILIRAYLNAETPAYGLRERMKAENVFPNKAFHEQLAKVDALIRKVSITKLKREPLFVSDVL
ncbi:hypothetical protein L6164_023179 [Bauhinia variegata]|uniref:Uncharacterized protein n=1 Tax=Bauhinia variegata TaxID=167791 RepID=A0ACB9ML07_BAUVA|nr:hypothetical protein L6164_023179 [Bauhinia variegata]